MNQIGLDFDDDYTGICPNCGGDVNQVTHRHKEYCSDLCRWQARYKRVRERREQERLDKETHIKTAVLSMSWRPE